jgi:hypothetical protein
MYDKMGLLPQLYLFWNLVCCSCVFRRVSSRLRICDTSSYTIIVFSFRDKFGFCEGRASNPLFKSPKAKHVPALKRRGLRPRNDKILQIRGGVFADEGEL